MGRPSTTITISEEKCTKCNTTKTVKKANDGKLRVYYTLDPSKPSNWQCEHTFNNKTITAKPKAEDERLKCEMCGAIYRGVEAHPKGANICKPCMNKQLEGFKMTKQTKQEDNKNDNRENAEYIARKIENKKDTEILQHYCNTKTPTLIYGDTGTGKTHALRFMAKINNMRYARIPCNGSTTPDQLLGHFVPNKEGGFKWADGIITDYVRNGGLVVLDEVNGMNPENAFALHGLLDDEKMIVLVDNDGEIIKAHPNFWICATMNPDYEGTKTLNEAFASRFRKLYFDYSDEAEKKLIEDKKLIEFAKKIRVMHRAGEIRTPLGTRTLLNFEKDKNALGEKVALHVMLNIFDEDQKAVIKEAFEMIVDSKRDDQTTAPTADNNNN